MTLVCNLGAKGRLPRNFLDLESVHSDFAPQLEYFVFNQLEELECAKGALLVFAWPGLYYFDGPTGLYWALLVLTQSEVILDSVNF